MKIKHTLYTITALAWMATLSTSFTACSSDMEEQTLQNEEISVAPFPSYATETRAVEGAPANEKTSWESGDIIYVQVNGGEWKTMEYTSEGWDTKNISIEKGQSYKAVYAPNYEIDANNKTSLILKSEDGVIAIGSTAEYLECEGQRPIYIHFTRNYARLRIYLGKEEASEESTMAADETTNPIELTFGEGFTTNDGSTLGTIKLQPDEEGNAYIYGSWKDGTKLRVTQAEDASKWGDPYKDQVYVAKQIYNQIGSASVDGKSYAINYDEVETAVIDDLDVDGAQAINDWTTYTDAEYTYLKVIGTWDEAKAPVFFNKDKDYSKRSAKFKHINLSQVTGLTKIVSNFVKECTTLKQIDLPETVIEIEEDAFLECTNLVLPKLPNGLQIIDRYAFQGCSNLSLEELPSSLHTIKYAAFSECKLCISTIPSNVTNLGSSIFLYCSFQNENGASFVWPSHLTTIPQETFCYSQLKSITIPKEVSKIELNAFNTCESLEKIICERLTPPELGTDVFGGCSSAKVLYVYEEAIESYQNDSSWKTYFDSDHIKSIESLSAAN